MNDTTLPDKPVIPWLRHETVMEMFYKGILVDGRGGGLVIGRSHEEGNIYLLYEVTPGRYEMPGSMEGGEYLLSHNAYILSKNRIDEINAWESPSSLLKKIEISERTRVLNTFGSSAERYILIDCRGQFIINKFATSKYFAEIEYLNHQAGDFTNFKLDTETFMTSP